MKLAALAFAALMALPAAAAVTEQDHDFAAAMIMHHQDGIEMSEMAVRKASSAGLRALAQKMIDEMKKDIGDLSEVAGGTTHTDPKLADMPGMMGMNMAWLEAKTGAEFDRAFSIAMIDHHLGGIKMAADEISKGSDAAAKRIARRIRTQQRGEVGQLARYK